MDNETILFDRIEKIKTTLENVIDKAYLSFSGGKDSTILHYLLDLAIPNNNIPRVFINTGIEYKYIVEFVKELQKKDKRIIIINPTENVKEILNQYGYPMKSKQHSHNLSIYQNSGITITSQRYLGLINSTTLFHCPNILKYQFTNDFKIKISDKCCLKLKKEPISKWEKQNNKNLVMTGMRSSEGGNRNNLNCIVLDKEKNIIKFHPLAPLNDEWCEWFIEKYKIGLCKLYYPPFNFKRTGCKGCPFSLDLQKQLNIMSEYLPNEKKQCEEIWKPIYQEYRKINYRLKKNNNQQLKLFEE